MHDFKIFLGLNDDSLAFHAKIKNKDEYEILHDFHNLYSPLFEDIVQGNMSYKYIVNDKEDAIENLTKFKKEYKKFHSFIVYFEKETV